MELPQAIVHATTALVTMIGKDGEILLVNPAMQRFTGQTEPELLGRPFWEAWVVPADALQARRAVAEALSGGTSFLEEADWLRGDGAWRRVSMQNSVVLDDDGQPYALAVVAIDVTEHRQREAHVQRKATTDALTGLWNRGVLFDALNQHLDSGTGQGCALLFCDVDHFKAVNDQHGHARGDQLLVEVAGRLLDFAGPEDLVGRFGGDEFVVLLPGIDEAHLPTLVSEVQARLREPLVLPDASLPFSVSIGGAYGSPGVDPDHVLAMADRSMYRMKRRRTAR